MCSGDIMDLKQYALKSRVPLKIWSKNFLFTHHLNHQ